MEENLTNIKERVIEVAKTKGFRLEDFFCKIGSSYGNFKGKSKNTALSSDAIAEISSIIPDLNLTWLITGSGEMLNKASLPQMLPATPETGIPLIPVDAMAGWLTGEVQFSPDDIAYYNLPNFRGADFIIKVKGDSMQPKYFSGDLAVCKRLPLSDLFFQWGKTYVLDTDQGALIKRIDKGQSVETINLVSYNKEYAPFELHRSSIHNVALVMGIIREE